LFSCIPAFVWHRVPGVYQTQCSCYISPTLPVPCILNVYMNICYCYLRCTRSCITKLFFLIPYPYPLYADCVLYLLLTYLRRITGLCYFSHTLRVPRTVYSDCTRSIHICYSRCTRITTGRFMKKKIMIHVSQLGRSKALRGPLKTIGRRFEPFQHSLVIIHFLSCGYSFSYVSIFYS
jgi:hypothetical protein